MGPRCPGPGGKRETGHVTLSGRIRTSDLTEKARQEIKRKVAKALHAYAKMTTGAAKGAVREVNQFHYFI